MLGWSQGKWHVIKTDSNFVQRGILEQHILHLFSPLCWRGHPQGHPSCSGQTAASCWFHCSTANSTTVLVIQGQRVQNMELWSSFLWKQTVRKIDKINMEILSCLTAFLMACKCRWETEMLLWVVMSP